MANSQTAGESAFEKFCRTHKIPYKRIDAGAEPTPDYEVNINGLILYVEIKDICEDSKFGPTEGSRTIGSHIRNKINEAKPQLKAIANKHMPTLLLIYNALDPYQTFGTEQLDFISAMYGELTSQHDRKTNIISPTYLGKNKSFTKNKNTSISSVGLIQSIHDKVTVLIYENIFAKNPINFNTLPQYIKIWRP